MAGYATGKSPQQLRGQSNLRHQHQNLPPLGQHILDQLEIDLRLTAARNAIQQVDSELAPSLLHSADGLLLTRIQIGTCYFMRALLILQLRLELTCLNPAFLHQGFDYWLTLPTGLKNSLL